MLLHVLYKPAHLILMDTISFYYRSDWFTNVYDPKPVELLLIFGYQKLPYRSWLAWIGLFSLGWCWFVFYGHFCTHGRLNGPSDFQRQWGEVKDETTFRYAHTEIRTRMLFSLGASCIWDIRPKGDTPRNHATNTSMSQIQKHIWVQA